MENVTYKMEKDFEQYLAQIEEDAVYEAFLDEDQRFIWGCSLQNDRMNYRLLSASDFASLHPYDAARAKLQKKSPFKKILVIFYLQNDVVCCKLINGMASLLFDRIGHWMNAISKQLA